ncbi:MAG: YigZ family protein [Salinivirgaceae bacterium]|nr:YigZ family protein [Salinivirgaceae bacterium]
MEIIDKYKTIERESKGGYKDKGSKFFAFAYPVTTEEEVKEIQKGLRKKYYDARHHVYAFRLGADHKTYRCSDDGEPSNSSGPPILGQLQSYDLTNILIVVIRYFGGTKLGIPGLINAYRTAAADAIENNTIIEKFEEDIFTIEFGYTVMNDVMKIIKDENPEQSNQLFDNTCRITIAVRKNDGEALREKFLKVDGLGIL